MLLPFFVSQDKIFKRMDFPDVQYIITDANYTRFYLQNGACHIARLTMKEALNKLRPEIFIQTHRSYAVSVFHIDIISRESLTIGEKVIPIAKQFYDKLIGKLQILGPVSSYSQ